MSISVLKKNIERLLEERNLSLFELERKAGTKRSIDNIFRNRSVNPSIDLIRKIAVTLNVDYKELLEPRDEELYIRNYKLLADVATHVISALSSLPKNTDISFDAVSLLIREAYSYAIQSSNKSVDEQFIKWLIAKYYN